MVIVAPDLRSFPRVTCSLRALSQCLSHLIGFLGVYSFSNLVLDKLNVPPVLLASISRSLFRSSRVRKGLGTIQHFLQRCGRWFRTRCSHSCSISSGFQRFLYHCLIRRGVGSKETKLQMLKKAPCCIVQRHREAQSQLTTSCKHWSRNV